MSIEGAPTEFREVDMVEDIYLPDGGYNEDYTRNRFGLGAVDMGQQVTFKSYKGTLAQALGDKECPLKGVFEDAYAEDGIAGVERAVTVLGMLDPNFKVQISDETRAIEEQKKKKQLQNVQAGLRSLLHQPIQNQIP